MFTFINNKETKIFLREYIKLKLGKILYRKISTLIILLKISSYDDV